MPVKFLSSSVLKWPDRQVVEQAIHAWAHTTPLQNAEVIRIGYFGSYARGNPGVGSDLDLLVILEESSLPFERRGARYDTTGLPVPTDALLYTVDEWNRLQQTSFGKTILREIIWVYTRD